MKVGQKSIVRWISMVAAKVSGQPARKPSVFKLRELDSEQLRHVGGGDGGASQSPKGTW